MAMERWRPGWGLAPWKPFGEMGEWERQLEEFFGRPMWKSNGERAWMPAIDVFEKDDKIVVKAELPGMKEEDIDVSVEGDMLTIRGEKESESEVKDEDYYRSERSYGSFYRSVPLPASADTEKVEASIEDGVLEVTIPKLAAVKAKKIAVAAKKKAVTGKAAK